MIVREPHEARSSGGSLDPEDWDAFARLAHTALEDMLTWMRTVRDRPAWRPLSDAGRAALHEPLPRTPTGVEATYASFVDNILEFPHGNQHPRFFGWVTGNGSPLGMLAEMLAAGFNPNVAGFEQAASEVETCVLEWFRELLGLPAGAGGVLVSGCSAANFAGIAAARTSAAPFDVREIGLAEGGTRFAVYASDQAHSSLRKAVELCGIGHRSLRSIPTGADFRMDVGALRTAIENDRRSGIVPMCVVASAGTVDTGAIDDLRAIADVCRRTGVWFHVDGAIGAPCALSSSLRPLLAGIESADSIAFDFHKWMNQPYDAGCILVRDAQMLEDTFSVQPPYLKATARGLNSRPLLFGGRGLQLARGFRALKIWMSLKAQGADAFADLMERNVSQAQLLAQRVRASARLELVAPPSLSIVNFRYCPPGMSEERADAINRELLMALQESGEAVVSNTSIRGRFSLRAAIVNHRTRDEDIAVLVRTVEGIGARLERAHEQGGEA